MVHAVPRCPICFNAAWHGRDGGRACTHCELAVDGEAGPAPSRAEIEAVLPRADRGGIAAAGWRLSAVALRNAAWALEHCWHDGAWRPAPAAIGATTPRIVLGVIGRASDLPAIEALVAETGVARAVAVLDGGPPAPDSAIPHLRVVMRRLEGDFGAQRNQLQRLAEQAAGGSCWVLQLDTDERPTPSLLRALGWMTEAADRDGLRSIGLPRRNLVDGSMSALFPDIQYRLNRSDIRFRNPVHERPEVPFRETTLGLCGIIEHRLDGVRVRARSIAYEAMLRGAGRPSDEQALLQPFQPDHQTFP